jgi:exo-beta-1,3-glucanase (GH17 family)
MTQIITERIKTFACQGIANVVWALAKFQFQQSLGLWQTG